jgi:integrase
MKPWDKQKLTKDQEKPVPDVSYIIDTAQSIQNERLKCLFVLLYLTGGRICELVRKKGYDITSLIKDKSTKTYKYNKTINPEKNKYSIKKKQISFENKNGREVVLISIRNEKHKKKKYKETPIPLDRPENKILIEIIKPYLNTLEMESELFPFGYQYAYRLLKPYFNPHWFRHIRATHLTLNYDLPTPLLRKYMGWTDDRQAGTYQELRWDDILEKL